MRLFRRRKRGINAQVSDDVILDVTVAVLTRKPESTLADIGRRARVSEREMHERFGSRQQLVDQALLRGARRLARSAFLEDGSPAQQIALLVGRLWDDQQPVAAFSSQGSRGRLQAQLDEILSPVRALVADAVTRGAREDSLRSDMPADMVAWLLSDVVVACMEALARGMISAKDARKIAVTQALSVAGLQWTEAHSVADSVAKRLD